jgi:hypothetical protein
VPDCGSGEDVRPPVTTAFGASPFWEAVDSMTVRLSATDETGVEATYYRLNGGPPVRYETPVVVSAEGTTTIRFWSVDKADPPNVEPEREVRVRLDRSAPDVAMNVRNVYAGVATVELRATDPHSGVADTFWQLDGIRFGVGEPGATKVVVRDPGPHRITYASWDLLGHETTGSAEFVVKRAQALAATPNSARITLSRRAGVAVWRPSVRVRATRPEAPFVDGLVPLAGKRVILQRSRDGVTWVRHATLTTSSTGVAGATLSLKTKGRHHFRWYSPATATVAAKTSARTIVTVR